MGEERVKTWRKKYLTTVSNMDGHNSKKKLYNFIFSSPTPTLKSDIIYARSLMKIHTFNTIRNTFIWYAMLCQQIVRDKGR